MSIAERNQRTQTVWPREKRVKLLGMCGYFTKEEMAEKLDVKVGQIVDMVKRMQASYKVTKNKEDYVDEESKVQN